MGKDNLDRFDFEQQLMDCWRITDDIRDTSEALLEGDLNTDETSNILIGLRQLYELKLNKLWDMFEGVIIPIVRENTILNDECTALRQQLMEATEMVPVITTKKDKK
jgi:hypothetical protein